MPPATDSTNTPARLTILQPATPELEMVRAADPAATPDEIRAGTSGCVNHLCGCR